MLAAAGRAHQGADGLEVFAVAADHQADVGGVAVHCEDDVLLAADGFHRQRVVIVDGLPAVTLHDVCEPFDGPRRSLAKRCCARQEASLLREARGAAHADSAVRVAVASAPTQWARGAGEQTDRCDGCIV
jgi:hypothetical protein